MFDFALHVQMSQDIPVIFKSSRANYDEKEDSFKIHIKTSTFKNEGKRNL